LFRFVFFIKQIYIHPKRTNISFPSPAIGLAGGPAGRLRAASGPPAGPPAGERGGVDLSFFSNNQNEHNIDNAQKQHAWLVWKKTSYISGGRAGGRRVCAGGRRRAGACGRARAGGRGRAGGRATNNKSATSRGAIFIIHSNCVLQCSVMSQQCWRHPRASGAVSGIIPAANINIYGVCLICCCKQNAKNGNHATPRAADHIANMIWPTV
jgi:hypothetical protein